METVTHKGISEALGYPAHVFGIDGKTFLVPVDLCELNGLSTQVMPDLLKFALSEFQGAKRNRV